MAAHSLKQTFAELANAHAQRLEKGVAQQFITLHALALPSEGGILEDLKAATAFASQVAGIVSGVGSVVGILSSLFGFGSGPSPVAIALDKIGKWMEKIDGQLTRMNVLLAQISQQIEGIKVYVNTLFIHDEEYHVRGLCQNYIEQIRIYKTDPANWGLDTRANLVNLQSDLITATRKLMQYGYAPVMTLIYAYRIELDLIMLLIRDPGNQQAALQTTAQTYHEYLDMCLDVNHPGSFAAVAVACSNEVDSLYSNYQAGDKGVLLYFEYTDIHEVGTGEREGFHTKTNYMRAQYNYRINGSIEGGFTGTVVPIGVVEIAAKPNLTNGPYGGPDAAANQLKRIVEEYNHASDLYKIKASSRDGLQQLNSLLTPFAALISNEVA